MKKLVFSDSGTIARLSRMNKTQHLHSANRRIKDFMDEVEGRSLSQSFGNCFPRTLFTHTQHSTPTTPVGCLSPQARPVTAPTPSSACRTYLFNSNGHVSPITAPTPSSACRASLINCNGHAAPLTAISKFFCGIYPSLMTNT